MKWEAREEWLCSSDGTPIRQMGWSVTSEEGEVCGGLDEKTARLIAAAPEMVEVIKHLMDPEHDCRTEGEKMDEPCPLGERARAVLKFVNQN